MSDPADPDGGGGKKKKKKKENVSKCSWCESLVDAGERVCTYCEKLDFWGLMKRTCILCAEDIPKTKEHFIQCGNFCKQCVNRINKNI